jgi:antirestriction protein ArdC
MCLEAMNVYELITNRIIQKMEQGYVPWRRPWTDQAPRNLVSKRAYQGINLLSLSLCEYDSPYWVTFRQAKALGGRIKKGERGTPVVFWKLLNVLDDSEKDEKKKITTIPLLKYSTVFNLTQTEGIPAPAGTANTIAPLDACERIISGFLDKPETVHSRIPQAFYRLAIDTIHMPVKTSFLSTEEYYSTLFHEFTHATGHEKRLNRYVEEHENIDFGSKEYSREELIAELGSAFLCAEAHIDNSVIDNNTAYLQSWLRVFQNDKKILIHASARAGKAVNYILGRKVA